MTRVIRSGVLHIRLEEAMHKRIMAMAKADRRSAANLIMHLLDTHPIIATDAKLNGHHEPKTARRSTSDKVATSG
mgnify:CR=1 FL=1